MTVGFLWPALLWALLLVPALGWLYFWLLRRRTRAPLTFPDVGTLSAAVAAGRRRRRHTPAALLLLGVALALVALARPTFPIPVPADRSAIMLVIDVSGSMRSTDIEPSRLEAAKVAAKAFLADLPKRVRVGLVTFGGYATLVEPPGTDRERMVTALDGLSFIRRTAIGEGLLEAVAALPGRVRPGPDGTLPAIPPGPKPPAFVILLSDGRSNTGIDAVEAARIARAQEVRVFTVGVGQLERPPGTWTIGGPLDESELRAIAQAAGGTYYHASSASALKDLYRRLARVVGWERRPDEVSALLALAGAVALVGSLAASRLLIHPLGF